MSLQMNNKKKIKSTSKKNNTNIVRKLFKGCSMIMFILTEETREFKQNTLFITSFIIFYFPHGAQCFDAQDTNQPPQFKCPPAE